MNELSKEKTMTVREVAEFLNVTNQTVRNQIRKSFPEVMENGKSTFLNEEQVTQIRQGLVNHHNLQSTFEVRKARTNLEIENSIENIIGKVLTPILQQQNEFNQRLINEIKDLKSNSKQIEFTQNYFSILGYCNFKGVQISFSDAIRHGKEAARISKERGLEIRKIPDERWGKVGSYHISILNELFEM